MVGPRTLNLFAPQPGLATLLLGEPRGVGEGKDGEPGPAKGEHSLERKRPGHGSGKSNEVDASVGAVEAIDQIHPPTGEGMSQPDGGSL